MLRKDRYALKKIVRYCNEIDSILKQIGRSYDRFESETVYQYALSMCLLQIGELVGHCSAELIGANPQIPWKYARAMRNLYAHDYDSARLDVVWTTLTDDIPAMKAQIEQLLHGTEDEDDVE